MVTMKKPPFIPVNVTFSLTGLIALFLVPFEAFRNGFDNIEIISAIVLFIFCGMSITAGYHRLWSQNLSSYHTNSNDLRFGGALAMQNSILHGHPP